MHALEPRPHRKRSNAIDKDIRGFTRCKRARYTTTIAVIVFGRSVICCALPYGLRNDSYVHRRAVGHSTCAACSSVTLTAAHRASCKRVLSFVNINNDARSLSTSHDRCLRVKITVSKRHRNVSARSRHGQHQHKRCSLDVDVAGDTL